MHNLHKTLNFSESMYKYDFPCNLQFTKGDFPAEIRLDCLLRRAKVFINHKYKKSSIKNMQVILKIIKIMKIVDV